MINFFILCFFLIYSFSIFFINQILGLLFVFVFNFFISFIVKVPLKKHFVVMKKSFKFILFIVLCNLVFSDITSSLKVGIRLFLAIDYTYIMNYYFNPTKIRIAFKYLFYPLKILKINIDNLTLIVAISLAFIPILTNEYQMIKLSIKNKGGDFKLINIIKRPQVYLITYLNNLFDMLEDLEKTLIMKGY